jgi:flagellar basal body rod protein FlgC
MDSYSTALSGIRSAHSMMYDAAVSVANGDMDRYAESFVQMIRARHAQAANIKTIQTQREMDRSLLDIFV